MVVPPEIRGELNCAPCTMAPSALEVLVIGETGSRKDGNKTVPDVRRYLVG